MKRNELGDWTINSLAQVKVSLYFLYFSKEVWTVN